MLVETYSGKVNADDIIILIDVLVRYEFKSYDRNRNFMKGINAIF